MSTDSLTKGQVNCAKQHRDVSPTFLKGSPGAAWATGAWSERGLGFSLWPHCCSEVIIIPFLGEPTESNDKSGLWCQISLASCPGPPTFYLIAPPVQNLSTFASSMKSRQYMYHMRSLRRWKESQMWRAGHTAWHPCIFTDIYWASSQNQAQCHTPGLEGVYKVIWDIASTLKDTDMSIRSFLQFVSSPS